MLKIAVCENNENARTVLNQLITDILKENHIGCMIDEFWDTPDLLKHFSGKNYDIIFLAILFDNEADGIEAGRQIRMADKNVELVYCTSSDAFLVQGYEVFSLGYLLKPVDRNKLKNIIDFFLVRHPSACTKTLLVKEHYKEKSILYDDIIYIESENKIVTIYTRDGRHIRVYAKLNDIEQKLLDCRFIRTCQSFLLNMDYITGYGDCCFYVSGGQKIPLRVKGISDILEKYYKYIGFSDNLAKTEMNFAKTVESFH